MIVGSTVLISTVVIVTTPLVNIAAEAYSVPPSLVPADAIVVLGSGLEWDGSLTTESMRRLLFGLRLYKKGLAPVLLLSGPGRDDTAPEATVRSKIAVELGVPPSAIIQLTDVKTTREEALQSAAVMKPRGVKHVLLVTAPLHMRRSKMVFEAAGFDVSAAPSDNFPVAAKDPVDRMTLFGYLFMHSAGFLYYRLAGYI